MIYSIQNLLMFFEFFTLHDQLVVANSRKQIYFEQEIFGCCFFAPCSSNSQLFTHNICSHFETRALVYLVKQSQSLSYEAFHFGTKPTLNPDRKTTGATIGYNVITCSQFNNLWTLQLATTKKKIKKKRKKKFILMQIASHWHNKPQTIQQCGVYHLKFLHFDWWRSN